jgi:hypothetical protein
VQAHDELAARRARCLGVKRFCEAHVDRFGVEGEQFGVDGRHGINGVSQVPFQPLEAPLFLAEQRFL